MTLMDVMEPFAMSLRAHQTNRGHQPIFGGNRHGRGLRFLHLCEAYVNLIDTGEVRCWGLGFVIDQCGAILPGYGGFAT